MPFSKLILISSLLISMLLAIVIISYVKQLTVGPIADLENKKHAQQIESLMPLNYDNDLINDRIEVTALGDLGIPKVSVYRARKNNEIVGIIIFPSAPDGYNGAINLAISLNKAGKILEVELLENNETPGFGGQIHQDKSDWLKNFQGKGSQDLDSIADIDQLSGASVSSNAVKKAISKCLLYFEREKESLCQPKTNTL